MVCGFRPARAAVSAAGVVVHGVAEPGQGMGQQPRHLHLGHPDPRGDLRLSQVTDEPQGDDPPFPYGQRGKTPTQRFAPLDRVEPRIGPAEHVEQQQVLAARRRLFERPRPVKRSRTAGPPPPRRG